MSRMRLFSLMMIACVLGVCALQGQGNSTRATELPSAPQLVTPSPSPTPTTEEKRPNVMRRFFGWTADKVKRPFRREPRFLCVLPPIVYLTASKSLITFCPSNGASTSALSCSPDRNVKLLASGSTPIDGDPVLFTWAVTGGTISGEGREVSWDLNGVAAGVYTATVEMSDGHQHVTSTSITVTVALCEGCERPPPPCPSVSVHGPSDLAAKTVTFEAIVEGGEPEMKPTFTWSITAGKIVSGQGTSKLIVDTSNLGGSRSLTAIVSLGGSHPACNGQQASSTINH